MQLKEVKLTLNSVPPSLNKMLNHHWAKRISDKQEVIDQINLIWLQLKKPTISSPVKITLEYFFKDNRARDYDNYSGKYILDGLKGRFIEDDNARDCVKELCLKMNFRSPETKTIITIKQVGKK